MDNDHFTYEVGVVFHGDNATYTNNLTKNGLADSERHGAHKLQLAKWTEWFLVIFIVGLLVIAVSFINWRIRSRRQKYYTELDHHQQQQRHMLSVSQLLEELRGRPRCVAPNEPLTENEKHFFIHDFAGYY